MEAEDLTRLLQPFFGQSASARAAVQVEPDIGLGLGVVKAFVELHGGPLTARSDPGRGSTFTITLTPEQPERVIPVR